MTRYTAIQDIKEKINLYTQQLEIACKIGCEDDKKTFMSLLKRENIKLKELELKN